MSRPQLPPELLDHVVDSLHDSRGALESCSLVAKTWIPRTRKHLFADIQFRTIDDLRSWKAVFPDPSTSPACCAKRLFISCPRLIVAAAAREGCWVSVFSCVVYLSMNTIGSDIKDRTISLVPFHGFSPVLKSLRVVSCALPHSQVFNLIYSFPLLEDVYVSTIGGSFLEGGDSGFNEQPTITQLSSSPVLTGSLELRSAFGTEPFGPRLLSLQGGLHFRWIYLTLHDEADVFSATALVEACCSTLESLKVGGGGLDLSEPALNLSKATKLKDIEFTFGLRPQLLLTTLRTVTCDHRELEQITLSVLSSQGLRDGKDVRLVVGENAYYGWLKLDRLLAELNESHSFRLKVLRYHLNADPDGSRERRRMGILLPLVMARGIVDLVSSRSRP